MKIGPQPDKWLRKKAKQGMRGYPVGTIAFYGPDNRRASKVAVSVIPEEGAEPKLHRWFSEAGDVRTDKIILVEIAAHLRQHSVRSVAMVDEIIGCPHEEGIDYPTGEDCPTCPYWKGRDRLDRGIGSGLMVAGATSAWRSNDSIIAPHSRLVSIPDTEFPATIAKQMRSEVLS